MRAFGCWFIAPQVNLLCAVPSVIWDLSGIPLGIGQRLFGICVHGAGGAVFFVPPAPEFVHRVLADFAEQKQSLPARFPRASCETVRASLPRPNLVMKSAA